MSRADVLAFARRLGASGLSAGRSGNVSLRDGEAMLITPSGVAYDTMTPDMIVRTRFDGSHEGTLLPSSEWRMHAAIYAARSEARAVVHCHSPYATALAALRIGIPPFHYMVAAAGGDDIRCAAYALFGTEALAAAMRPALEGRRACLLANHGQIAFGASLDQALETAQLVEELAHQYWAARLVGEPVLLTHAEMAEAHERFRSYGKQPAQKGMQDGR